jgi:hypothetical protein
LYGFASDIKDSQTDRPKRSFNASGTFKIKS